MNSNRPSMPWDALAGTQGVPDAVKAAVQRQADLFWRAQLQSLDAMQTLTTGWFDRRREGAEAARTAVAAVCSCTDPLEVLRACQNWTTGSMERIAADMLALQSQASALFPALAGSMTAAINVSAPSGTVVAKAEPTRTGRRSEAA